MQAHNSVRRKVVWGTVRWLAIAAVAFMSSPGCGPLTESGRSASFMIIDNLRGASGATPTQFTNSLASDVVDLKRGILEDPGQVTIRLGLKDFGSPSAPNTPTITNYITVTHYRIDFKRSDGRNMPGIDVPHPIEGGMTFTVVGGITTGTFLLVRAQAKLEPPLITLQGVGGALVISTIAEVTFYGHDQTGVPVSATGYITVNFADWADPA
ncbi:MAG: hypothetical protein A3J75_04555 [Acidobacteria bacterium RBG_16_68_9]|nr:MAG: hypothetical protein A3J75_04555 [Acidobacteria bacterium RBG_16_68_9]